MAEKERRLTARLLELTDELAALVVRSQKSQREMQAIVAKIPVEKTASKPSRRGTKRSVSQLQKNPAEPRQ